MRRGDCRYRVENTNSRCARVSKDGAGTGARVWIQATAAAGRRAQAGRSRVTQWLANCSGPVGAPRARAAWENAAHAKVRTAPEAHMLLALHRHRMPPGSAPGGLPSAECRQAPAGQSHSPAVARLPCPPRRPQRRPLRCCCCRFAGPSARRWRPRVCLAARPKQTRALAWFVLQGIRGRMFGLGQGGLPTASGQRQ